MKKKIKMSKRSKNAAKILFSWRKAMPIYYLGAWVIIIIIVLL